MLAAATSFFSRTNISTNYNIGQPSTPSLPGFGSGSRSSTPGPSNSSTPNAASLPPPQLTPSFHVGMWKVQAASHKVTNKRVSVWSFDKRAADGERHGWSAAGKDRVIEALKAEVGDMCTLPLDSLIEIYLGVCVRTAKAPQYTGFV